MAALRLISILAGFAASAFPAQSAGTPQILASNQVLRGHFVQERQMSGFSKPLKSEGSFTLVPGRGLIWHNEKPFSNSTVITAGGIVQLSGAQETMRLSAARVPGLTQLYQALNAALSGDTTPLKKTFAVTQSESRDGWQVSLKPLNTGLQTQIMDMVLKGGRYVESAEIVRPGGDSDRIIFSGHDVTMPGLTAGEAAALKAADR
jgi:Outer membrane lipoprotein carrier protein LolA.